MEKIKVILADDDFSSRSLLSRFTQLIPDFEVIGEASNGEDLIHQVMKQYPDVILVDITMPIINGVEAVKACREIHPQIQVIFTTGHTDFAVEAFNISAVDYIVKPIEMTRFFTAMEKVKKVIQLQKKQTENIVPNTKKLSIRSNSSFLYLSFQDILYIEKEGRKSIIHTLHDRFESSELLQDLETLLPENFYKSHRSYLINLNKIEKIEPVGETYLAYFSEGKVAHISKLKINEVYKLLAT